MIGVELVLDQETKEAAVQERNAIIQRCFQRGLLLLGCGISTIRFVPPLIVKQSQAEEALDIFDAALTEIESKGTRR